MITKSTAAVLVVISLLIGGVVGYYWGYNVGWEQAMQQDGNQSPNGNNNANSNNDNQTQAPNPEQDQFRFSETTGYYGTLTLTGYIDIQDRDGVSYAYFVADDPNNDAWDAFMALNEGNSFAGGNRVGLGCYQESQDRIYYENFSDANNVDGAISGGDLEKLLDSTEENKVQVRLVRDVYLGGRGAPDCYSHFRNIDVL